MPALVVDAYLVAEERAGDVDELGSNDNDLLAGEELLGQGSGETTEEVSLAVNDVWVCLLEGHLCDRKVIRQVVKKPGKQHRVRLVVLPFAKKKKKPLLHPTETRTLS